MKTYRLNGTRLLHEGRTIIRHHTAQTIVKTALRKKIRSKVRRFLTRACHDGEATLRWNFVRKVKEVDDHWVQLHVRYVDNEYRFFVSGPRAADLVRRLNEPGRKTVWQGPVFLSKEERKYLRKKGRERQKQLRNEERRKERLHQAELRRKKRARVPRPDPIKPAQVQVRKPRKTPSHNLLLLTPQFRKSTLSWDDAIDLALATFQVPRDNKNTARQIVARRLYNSLDKCDWRFAQYTQGGFTLQFEMRGPWLVDTATATVKTRVTASCTKDNRNPIYRRLRKHLHKQRRHGLHEPLRLTA